MINICFYGIGGEGVVSAAEIAALSAWKAGNFALCYPSFGPERTGQPVAAYIRLDKQIIRSREPVMQADWLIVSHKKLLELEAVKKIIKSKTKLILNSPDDFNADLIAKNVGQALSANIALIAHFGKLSTLFSLKDLNQAIEEKFKGKSQNLITANMQAAKLAYEHK